MALVLAVLVLTGCDDGSAPAANVPPPDDPAVQKYLAATQTQAQYLKDARMDVEMTGRLPKLKKEGKMQALRLISQVGKVTYDAIRFTGDKTVKDNVIVSYLKAESSPPKVPMGITPGNYKFKNKGLQQKEGLGTVQVIELQPRRKAVGLFKGEIWTDPNTGAPLQESGRFVRSPSVFLRSVDFVRKYEPRDGTSVPVAISSVVDTRIAGKAELDIAFSNFAKGAPSNPVPSQSTAAATQPNQ